jgi:hypothetical protein
MLKIYNPGRHISDELHGSYHENFLTFDIETKDWLYTTDIHEADIVPIHGHNIFGDHQIYHIANKIKEINLRPEQKLLFMHIFHIDNCFTDRHYYLFARKIFQQELQNQFAIVHTNFGLDSEIQYDFLWNRQKIYFTDYNRIDLKDRTYTIGTDIKNFELGRIEKITDKKTNSIRKFICPNRVYKAFDHIRLEYRRKLREFLTPYEDQGHLSDPVSGKILDAENTFANQFLDQGGWHPVANHYYQGTYFSIYCETITGNVHKDLNYKSLTEKTYDPLIKGHFILPFGYQGMIDHIKSYGFKLPDWIDYSYDRIEDTDDRFDAFLESAKKLLSLEIPELHKFYENDRHMLIHNRQMFWDRPYDSLHDKVVEFFQIGK